MKSSWRSSLTRLVGTVVLVVGLLIIAGCSGIPRSSRPETIRPIDGSSPVAAVDIGPQAGAEPRSIVSGFLQAAAASSDAHHSGSRQYLTSDAGSRWQDSPVTIVNDIQIQLADSRGETSTVKVTGQEVGSIDASGIYSAQRAGSGLSKQKTFTFTLKRGNNAWRIDQLPAGVLIRKSDFEANYAARPVYFYDLGQTQLIPDLRYSALSGQELAEWLLAQILAGPRPELVQSVRNELPNDLDVTRKATVTANDRIVLDIPGSSQLDGPARTRLATQLAYTFGPVVYSARVSLTDAGKPVAIPSIGTAFSMLDFPGKGPDSFITDARRFYLRTGGLVNGTDNKAVAGPVGNGTYGLTSMALRQTTAGGLQLAGLGKAGLVMGSAAGPLAAVSLPPGALSRPEFQPGSAEAWIGVGANIYRVGTDRRAHLVSVPATVGGSNVARVVALRFSPDGARLAVVLQGNDGTRSLWIGSVTQSDHNVSIAIITPVTPVALNVADVAWKDATTLFMIASAPNAEPQVWTVQSDGSYLDVVQSSGLSRGLRSIAAVAGEPPLVVTDGPAIWVQRGSGWEQLSGSEGAAGYGPAYALPSQ
jgi:hypothetical protein